MGLFDMFGAGGGSLAIQPVSPHVTPGQALVGNVVFTGGGRAQQINALTIRLTQETRTMQMTNQGPQPRTDSRDIVPATPLTNPFMTTPGQPTALPFQLQVPPGLPNSVPQQVTYHLRTTADIPGEVDPGASLEVQVVGGIQPQMGMPQQGMMQPGMMQPGMQQGMMQPGMPGMPGGPGMPGQMGGMMQAGMAAMGGMMQPGMMQPGMMQPGMQQGMQPQMGMGQMQIANGTRVHAQYHGDGQFHPGTVTGMQNGMYAIDWQEPRLGATSYVYPQQIQVPSGAPGMGMGQPGMGQPMGKPHDMHAKDMKAGHDPYGKQPDPYGKGAPQQDYGKQQHDPYGKQGHDMHGKGGQPDHGKQQHDPYGKQGHDAHGKGGGMPPQQQHAAPQKSVGMGQHVTAQHANGNWYPGRVAALQNGMVGVDWDDPNLGQSSWVQPHQVRG